MRKVALGALALLPLATFACTAILGDFQVGSTANIDGGGNDGTTTTDGGGNDGTTTDADPDSPDAQNTVFTTCGISESAVRTIVEVDEPDGGGAAFYGDLKVFRVSPNVVRVVTQRNTFTGSGATVYSFEPNKNGSSGPIAPPTVLDLQSSGRFLDVRRLGTQGILAMLFYESAAGAPLAHLKVIELPDGNLTAQTPVVVSADFSDKVGSGGSGNFSGSLGAYATNDEYFWAVGGYPSSTVGSYDLMVGHSTAAKPKPTPVVVYTTTDDRVTRIRDMARSKTVQYIFNDVGPDGPNDKGSSYFIVPQDGTTAVTLHDLRPANGTKPYVMFGATGLAAGDGIRVAAAEVDFNSTNFGSVHAGIVPQADLDMGFDGSKIPQAFTLNSFTEVPSEGEARFFGDDMLWLGTPPDPLRGQGLNFLWFNTATHTMRSKQTGMQRMLATHTNIDKVGVWLDTQTTVIAEADVVFVEKASPKVRLQYARMTCIR